MPLTQAQLNTLQQADQAMGKMERIMLAIREGIPDPQGNVNTLTDTQLQTAINVLKTTATNLNNGIQTL